ncbi:ABC transporter permease [Ferruginibacter yonginensis]|uniref:Transport permease protein n=1 Tax=Ferruginibacter yonginensis TaxID=1310416 RepID=A0ABV8QNS2_9BACT
MHTIEKDIPVVTQWDEVIVPSASLFDLRLKEVWRYRDLLLLFVKRDFTAQYKQTVLGPLWHFIQPIFTTVVFLLVFHSIANIPTDGIEVIPFYMSGIAIWNYFSSCLTGTSSTFVANAHIFGKVYFPRMVIPLSNVMSNVVKFGIQFILLLAVMVWFGFKTGHFYISFTWLLLPVLVLMMAGMGLGLGIIISSLTTKYRDFTVLIGFAVQLLMYATPVVYPLSYLQNKSYQWVIAANPLTPIVEAFRYALFGKGSFDGLHLMYSGIFIIVTLFIGTMIFNKVERGFMDTV